MAELVTIEDIADPLCSQCGFDADNHGPLGQAGGCPESPGSIRRSHIEAIVRREIAKELEQLAQDEAEDMLSESDYGPDATVYRAVTVASILERAEAIRNG